LESQFLGWYTFSFAASSSECHWALPIPLDYFRSDLLETDSGYELKIDLPDVKKDQINIELDSSRKILQVSLSQSEETENKNKNYLLNERSTSLFTRRYNLPCAVDGESVRAALQDGVLAISLNRIQAENDVIQVQIVWCSFWISTTNPFRMGFLKGFVVEKCVIVETNRR